MDRAFIRIPKMFLTSKSLRETTFLCRMLRDVPGSEEIAYEMNPVFPVVPLRDWRWCTTRL